MPYISTTQVPDAYHQLLQKAVVAANKLGLDGEKITRVHIDVNPEDNEPLLSFVTLDRDIETRNSLQQQIADLNKQLGIVNTRIRTCENIGSHIRKVT